MPFFQNPFTYDFEGNWLLGDRQHMPKFVVRRNFGRTDDQVTAWAEPTYNLSGNDADGNSKAVLTLSFALNNFYNWADLPITISASSLAATTAVEVYTSLNANPTFAGFFIASLDRFESGQPRLVIKSRQPATNFRFYVKTGRAESVLLFNKRAGVAEMPTYFSRHSIANRFQFPDSQNAVIELDPSVLTQAAVIDNAVDNKGASLNYSSSTVHEDYELLAGRSGLYIFTKNTYTGDNVTSKIEYHAGAVAGDLGKKTTYVYSGDDLASICEIPYVLENADLVTPP